MTRVTNHAARRTKERLGLPKKLSHKNAENALRYGIRHSDTSGSLNRYISALYWKHETANNVRIYCNNVYIFHGETLITIFPLPQKYRKTAARINRKTTERIPEKIKIGGKTYTVEITNKMDLGINNVSAEILYGDLIIRVSPQATAKMEADFIHEMVHAIYFGLGYRDHDEKRVDELANALHSVIVDNPDVFAPAEVGRHES